MSQTPYFCIVHHIPPETSQDGQGSPDSKAHCTPSPQSAAPPTHRAVSAMPRPSFLPVVARGDTEVSGGSLSLQGKWNDGWTLWEDGMPEWEVSCQL